MPPKRVLSGEMRTLSEEREMPDFFTVTKRDVNVRSFNERSSGRAVSARSMHWWLTLLIFFPASLALCEVRDEHSTAPFGTSVSDSAPTQIPPSYRYRGWGYLAGS